MSRSFGEMARHNSRDDTSLLNAGGNGTGTGMFGSRSGSRRGSMMSGDGVLRNGSIAGGDENVGGDLEHESSQQQQRKVCCRGRLCSK